ncbi:MAG: hypothetical protein NTX13_08245 [Acidobacteria bacterium]|nr:hypothetical protein [Acidobacteriota bacterium]
MIKALLGILVSILAVTFLRAVMGLLVKGAKEALQPDETSDSGSAPPESGTRLRKCKTCGTFAPETRMLRHSTRETDVFYCSKDCEKQATA